MIERPVACEELEFVGRDGITYYIQFIRTKYGGRWIV